MYFCWICNRLFCNSDNTYFYRKINDTKTTIVSSKEVEEFVCVKCGLKVGRQSQLETHTRLKHEDVVHFNCEDSAIAFRCNKKNKLHRKSTFQLSCQKCGNKFLSAESSEEIMNEHEEIKNRVKTTKKEKNKGRRKTNKKQCKILKN